MEEGSDNDGPVTKRDGLTPKVVLAGKYRVERPLATGGMGRLVVARQLELERDVVVKVMHTELVRDELMTTRFFREAKLLAALESDHVVKILDIGRLDDQTPYLVMELLEGEDLEARCERGPIPVDDAVRFIVEACEGLAEAHAIGVIHRDVKPQNLFLARSRSGVERIKVLDFGIAKKTTTTASRGATTGESIIGSPAFMAPEQITSSRDVDARADIWSLGATLYQLLAGSPPFRGEDNIKVLSKILHTPVPPIDLARPGVSSKLAEIVHACLAKKPEDRPQTVKDLAERLAAFRTESTQKTISKERRPKRRKPPIMLLTTLATVLVGIPLLILLILAYRTRPLSARDSVPTSSDSVLPVAPSSSPSVVTTIEPPVASSVVLRARASAPPRRPSTAAVAASIWEDDPPPTPEDGGRRFAVNWGISKRELQPSEHSEVSNPAFESKLRECARGSEGKVSGRVVVFLKGGDKKPSITPGWNIPQPAKTVESCVVGVFTDVHWLERREDTTLRISLFL